MKKYRIITDIRLSSFKSTMIDLISHSKATRNQRSKMMKELHNLDTVSCPFDMENVEFDKAHEKYVDYRTKGGKQ